MSYSKSIYLSKCLIDKLFVQPNLLQCFQLRKLHKIETLIYNPIIRRPFTYSSITQRPFYYFSEIKSSPKKPNKKNEDLLDEKFDRKVPEDNQFTSEEDTSDSDDEYLFSESDISDEEFTGSEDELE